MKKKEIIKLIIFLTILATVLIGSYLFSRISKKIPKNPDGTVGNTASNLYNGGYFCEDAGKVYFSNSYDNGALYVMNPDETDIKPLIKSKCNYINAGGDYLYFYMSDSSSSEGLGFIRRVMGIYRCKKNGKGIATLDRSPSISLVLANNSIYYQRYNKVTGTELYKMDTNGDNQIKFSDKLFDPSCIYNNQFYYNNTDTTFFLYTTDLYNTNPSVFLDYDVYYPIREDNYVYFLDIHDDYKLCRYDIENDSLLKLTTKRVDCYNITDDYIFFQENDKFSPALKKMKKDGTDEEIVLEGTYTNLCATSQYLYFQEFSNDFHIEHVPLDGGEADDFLAAFEAVSQ